MAVNVLRKIPALARRNGENQLNHNHDTKILWKAMSCRWQLPTCVHVSTMLHAATSQRHRRVNFTSRSDSHQFGWGSNRIPSQNKSRHNLYERLTALKYVHIWNSETIAPPKAQVSVVPEIKQETLKINTRICQKVKWYGRWQIHSHKPPTTRYIHSL